MHDNGCGREPTPDENSETWQLLKAKQLVNDAIRMRILGHIEAERDAQDEQWGGHEHDDQHTPEEWQGILQRYVNRLADNTPMDFRTDLIKITAIGLAAIESFDRQQGKSDG